MGWCGGGNGGGCDDVGGGGSGDGKDGGDRGDSGDSDEPGRRVLAAAGGESYDTSGRECKDEGERIVGGGGSAAGSPSSPPSPPPSSLPSSLVSSAAEPRSPAATAGGATEAAMWYFRHRGKYSNQTDADIRATKKARKEKSRLWLESGTRMSR